MKDKSTNADIGVAMPSGPNAQPQWTGAPVGGCDGGTHTMHSKSTEYNCDREKLLCPARENLLRENERLRAMIAEMTQNAEKGNAA